MTLFENRSTAGRTATIPVLTVLLLSVLQAQASPGKDDTTPAPEKAVVYKQDQPGPHQRMAAKILIHARPEIVWDTVHEERRKDPDIAYAKILEQGKNDLTIEEKFVLLPVIGTAVCVMKDTEVPNERIDYRLVSSDHFRAMEGSWVLTSCDGGRSTILELSSYLELGIPVPRMVLDGLTGQKLQRRLTNIKVLAEKAQARSTIGART